jgi:hypothetical protein
MRSVWGVVATLLFLVGWGWVVWSLITGKP